VRYAVYGQATRWRYNAPPLRRRGQTNGGTRDTQQQELEERNERSLIVVLILGFLWTEGGAQMTEVNMGIATLKFEDVADPTIIEKLEKNGFIDSLYK